MFLRILGASTLSITLNLYIMEYIPKHGLVQSESLRLTLGTFAWTFGPSFGVWLYVRFGFVAPLSLERDLGAHPDRALLVAAPLGQHRDPAGQAPARQPDRQHQALRRAAAPAACLAHRLRPLLLLDDLLRLRARS